jgi:hypothetical protein
MLMITLRQHGAGVALALAVVGGAAVILVLTGLRMHAVEAVVGRSGMGWLAGAPAYPWHHPADLAYNWRMWNSLLRVLWAIAGVSAGVPLVCREIEEGTAAFAWTQGTP